MDRRVRKGGGVVLVNGNNIDINKLSTDVAIEMLKRGDADKINEMKLKVYEQAYKHGSYFKALTILDKYANIAWADI